MYIFHEFFKTTHIDTQFYYLVRNSCFKAWEKKRNSNESNVQATCNRPYQVIPDLLKQFLLEELRDRAGRQAPIPNPICNRTQIQYSVVRIYAQNGAIQREKKITVLIFMVRTGMQIIKLTKIDCLEQWALPNSREICEWPTFSWMIASLREVVYDDLSPQCPSS